MVRHAVLALLVVNMWVFSARADYKPENKNAATHYRKAFSLLPKLTDAEKELLDQVLTTPLEDKAGDLIKRSEPALQELHRGAALSHCDWGLDLSEKWFDQFSPLLMNSRQLSQLACLRARYWFEQKQSSAGVDDLMAVIVMGRHIGRNGLFIALILQFALENAAIDLAGACLPELDDKVLMILRQRLDGLPKPNTLGEGIQKENEFVTKVVRPEWEKKFQGKRIQELRELLRKDFAEEEVKVILKAAGEDARQVLKLLDESITLREELTKVVMLPREQFQPALSTYKSKHEAANPFAAFIVPTVEGVRYAADRTEARFGMLKAAVAIRSDGPDQLKNFKDPFAKGPFEYRPTKGGFELKSKLEDKDRPPATLAVGKVKKD